jgi:HK97 family phage prohead protease
MERTTFELEFKELSEEGQFSGYLSTFDNVDAGGDMVEPGAFKKTLREKKAFPLNWGHVPSVPDLVVGSFGGKEDEKGLKVDGEFFLDLEGGKKAYLTAKKLFEKGIKMGLSMGYKTMKYINETVDGLLVRKLKEVKLKEGALTLFPMNEEAGLDAIKSEDLEQKPSAENHICRRGGGDYVRYRSEKRKSGGKEYTVRYGITKAGKAEEYEYFYPVAHWSASEARKHCSEHGGRFIPAKNKKDEGLCSSCGQTLLPPTEPDVSPFKRMAAELKAFTREGKPSGEDEPNTHSLLERTAEELKEKSS